MALVIRTARLRDAPAMGRLTVAGYLAAHRGQIPEQVWITRRDEWTAEVSARNWARTLRAIAHRDNPGECVYLAVDTRGGEVIGVAMGNPAEDPPWRDTGAISALYVRQDHQGRGLGRRLVRVVARHLRRHGMPALTISVLEANTPARDFYAALGGQVVGVGELNDSGHLLPEVVYGWPDTTPLIATTRHAT
jgi:GNAT superfamily N-acetyltransferase